MKKLTFAVILAGFGLGWGGPVAAQQLPFQRNDRDQNQATFRALLLTHFQETVKEWTTAVNSGDLDAVAELYTDDAFLYLHGPVRGEREIRTALTGWLGEVAGVQVGLADFEASSKVTYGSAHVRVTPAGTGDVEGGTMVLVLRREGQDTWKIRSQTLLLD